MQTMIPAVFDRKAFDATLRNMTDEDAAAFASANLGTFAGCFAIGSAPPAGPGPAKARPARTEPVAEDPEALKRRCLDFVKAHPASKAETVAGHLYPPGVNTAQFGKAVKKALESLVDDKALSCEGERRGRKYTAMTPRAEPEAAE